MLSELSVKNPVLYKLLSLPDLRVQRQDKSRPCPIGMIPELVLEILSRLSSQDDINRCRQVCRKWAQLATDPLFMHNLVRSKEYIICNMAFGSDHWTKCFGENAISAEDRKLERETLPDNIFEILNSNCPAFPGKKVKETHMLVFIPKTINGELLTLKSLGKLAKKYFPKNKDGYESFWSDVARIIGNKTIEPGWRLMTTRVLEESRNKIFANPTNAPGIKTQQQCVAELAEKAGCNYVVLPALDAAACILAQYFKDSQTRLFSDKPLTFIRCQENVNGYQVIVGGFGPAGLNVRVQHSLFDNDYIGVAALRKF